MKFILYIFNKLSVGQKILIVIFVEILYQRPADVTLGGFPD